MGNIQKLAFQLAINYYNVSVVGKNLGVNDSNSENLGKIFNKDNLPSGEDLKFTRNILIVGAGASISTYDFILTSTKLIEAVYTNLRVSELFKVSSVLWRKFTEEASKITSNPRFGGDYSEKEFKRVVKTLEFEDNMSLLISIFNKKIVSEEIENCLMSYPYTSDIVNYLPSLFYETVAHLFKHRFIDVIINLNFDELLDNAIKDEMGETDYAFISDESERFSLNKIFDRNRLRMPIYVKPHGTFKSRYSLKFTNEDYLNTNSNTKDLLDAIFKGYIGNDKNYVNTFNISFAGYRLNDIDIREYLFQQLLNGKEVSYFVFDIQTKSVKKRFVDEFDAWVKKNKDIHPTDASSIKRKLSTSFSYFSCDLSNYVKPETDERGLGLWFKELYEEMQKLFRLPYRPNNLTRHNLLTEIFPRENIIHQIRDILNHPESFYLNKAIFYAIYDFVKFKGRVPINVLTSDRAGSYQQLYFEQMRTKDGDALESETNLIGEIQDIFADFSIKVDNLYVYSEKLLVTKDHKEEVLKLASRKLLDLRNRYPRNRAKKIREQLHETLDLYVYSRRVNEINAIYNDTKHGRFLPFNSENIIITNLELTLRLFEYATNKRWDKLLMIDDTGKPLFNLCKEAKYIDDPKNCYLTEIVKQNKEIQLIHAVKEGELNAKDKNDFDVNTIAIISQIFEDHKKDKNFTSIPVKDVYQMHKMAIFLEKEVPIFGIYFFKPSIKVRINPVFFDTRFKNKDNSLENLKTMIELFNLSKQ